MYSSFGKDRDFFFVLFCFCLVNYFCCNYELWILLLTLLADLLFKSIPWKETKWLFLIIVPLINYSLDFQMTIGLKSRIVRKQSSREITRWVSFFLWIKKEINNNSSSKNVNLSTFVILKCESKKCIILSHPFVCSLIKKKKFIVEYFLLNT